MASESIQGRVDGDLWRVIKQKGETTTQVLQRLTAHYVATSADELTAIAPTPAAAVAILLHSHNMLNRLMENPAIALPAENTTAPPMGTTTAPPETTEQSAFMDADNY